MYIYIYKIKLERSVYCNDIKKRRLKSHNLIVIIDKIISYITLLVWTHCFSDSNMFQTVKPCITSWQPQLRH